MRRATLSGFSGQLHKSDFYPRPPRGGRPSSTAPKAAGIIFLSTPSARRATILLDNLKTLWKFLSTPSARRATFSAPRLARHAGQFLSTPSARRATRRPLQNPAAHDISIHALREEGDYPPKSGRYPAGNFYPRPPRGGRRRVPAMQELHHIAFLSTPSARRATTSLPSRFKMVVISIHALREEGDQK